MGLKRPKKGDRRGGMKQVINSLPRDIMSGETMEEYEKRKIEESLPDDNDSPFKTGLLIEKTREEKLRGKAKELYRQWKDGSSFKTGLLIPGEKTEKEKRKEKVEKIYRQRKQKEAEDKMQQFIESYVRKRFKKGMVS